MGYLVCEKCEGYYELEPGESPEDFTDECDCGGNFVYVESLDDLQKDLKPLGATVQCPKCGAENPEDAKICKSCHKVLKFAHRPSIEETSKTYSPYKESSTASDLKDSWNKRSFGVKVGLVLGIVLILGLTAVFAVIPAYNSMMYNSHLSKANEAVVLAKTSISQAEPLTKPIDTNIKLTNQSMGYVDQAIGHTEAMSYYAPNQAAKEYADLRLKQYQEIRHWDEMAIRGYEEMKSSGTLAGAITFAATSGSEIDAIWQRVSTYQNQIITLVDNNPELKQRRIDVLGEEMANQGLQTYNPKDDHTLPYM